MSIIAKRLITLRRKAALLTAALLFTLSGLIISPATAATGDDFNLQISPATLTSTIKPGVDTDLELKIRNRGANTEQLKIEAREFSVDKNGQNIKIGNSTPADLAEWISYSDPRFSLKSDETLTQKIHVNLPDQAGFSYPFAIIISRADEKAVESNGRLIKASVAIFALIDIDKPGATRSFEIEELKTTKEVYDYLPAEIELQLRNTGNTIVQPFGNFYVQRGSDDTSPLAVLPLNQDSGYILPNTTRTFKAVWNDGFHRYKTISPDGKERENLKWDWGSLSKLRIGRYTAKVVAVYNDGQRDIPVIGEVQFWVFPWKFVLVVLIVILLILFGIGTVVRTVIGNAKKLAKRVKKSSD